MSETKNPRRPTPGVFLKGHQQELDNRRLPRRRKASEGINEDRQSNGAKAMLRARQGAKDNEEIVEPGERWPTLRGLDQLVKSEAKAGVSGA